MNRETIDLVRMSYGRCLLDGRFFDKFYDEFLRASPEISAKFAGTNFSLQQSLTRKGINMMIRFAKGDNLVANNMIARIRETHSANHHDIQPHLYKLWKAALLKTIKSVDLRLDSETESAWSQVLDIGIKEIADGYYRDNKKTA